MCPGRIRAVPRARHAASFPADSSAQRSWQRGTLAFGVHAMAAAEGACRGAERVRQDSQPPPWHARIHCLSKLCPSLSEQAPPRRHRYGRRVQHAVAWLAMCGGGQRMNPHTVTPKVEHADGRRGGTCSGCESRTARLPSGRRAARDSCGSCSVRTANRLFTCGYARLLRLVHRSPSVRFGIGVPTRRVSPSAVGGPCGACLATPWPSSQASGRAPSGRPCP